MSASLLETEDRREQRSSPQVDYHCHISITEYSDIEHPTVVSVTLEEFLADLDEAGIEKAVVLSDGRTTPEQVSAFVGRAPERLMGFGYVNSVERGASDDVRRQRNELSLFGLKLYPTSDGYRVNDERAFEVYEAAVDLGARARRVHQERGWRWYHGNHSHSCYRCNDVRAGDQPLQMDQGAINLLVDRPP